MTPAPRHDLWTASDGTRVGRLTWIPSGKPRARIIALHGLSCRAEDFAPLGETFAAHGIQVEAGNLRGQGLDPVASRRATWLDVDGMLADLAALAGSDETPLFLCGESMGALLAIRAGTREEWKRRLAGLLLFVPVVGLRQKTPTWIRRLLRAVAAITPNLRLKPSWFVHGAGSLPQLTRIASRQRELATAPHRLGPVGIGFLVRMGDLIETASAAAPELRTPLALFSAGNDAFLRREQMDDFFARAAFADKTHFHYAESFHQLLFEWNTAQVLHDAMNWVEARLPTR